MYGSATYITVYIKYFKKKKCTFLPTTTTTKNAHLKILNICTSIIAVVPPPSERVGFFLNIFARAGRFSCFPPPGGGYLLAFWAMKCFCSSLV
jgi:hypothetical protein